MEDLIFLFALTVVLASLLAGIGIWSPRNYWVKACAVATATLLFGAGYTSENGRVRANLSGTTTDGHWGVGAGLSFTLN